VQPRKRKRRGLDGTARIHSLPLTDWDGAGKQWNLDGALAIGRLLELPRSGTAPALLTLLGTYLSGSRLGDPLVERLASR